MSTSPLELPAQDKLDILRYLDEFHYWHSLDDERRCKRCGHLITGRQILVLELDGTRGKMRLQCPTVACVSTPGDWVYADPFLAAKLRRDFRPGLGQLDITNASLERTHQGRAEALRKPTSIRKFATRRSILAPAVSLRAFLARLKLLRPMATALHAIRPVA